jgi:hypothetical protein
MGGSSCVTLASGEIASGRDFGSRRVAAPETNRAPVVTSIPPAGAVVGRLYRYDPQVTDADGDRVQFGISPSSSFTGLTVDSFTGTVVWVALEPAFRAKERALRWLANGSTPEFAFETYLTANETIALASTPRGWKQFKALRI